MVLRIVKNDTDRKALLRFLADKKAPFSVDIQDGRRRSAEQNKLQRLWCNEIAQHLEDRTAEEVRGEIKLQFGVPILRAENERFREVYDRVIRPLPYATKLELMMEPIDLPVTRLMTVDQKTRYLNAVLEYYTAMGIELTLPTNGV